jgi:hypothetical protein
MNLMKTSKSFYFLLKHDQLYWKNECETFGTLPKNQTWHNFWLSLQKEATSQRKTLTKKSNTIVGKVVLMGATEAGKTLLLHSLCHKKKYTSPDIANVGIEFVSTILRFEIHRDHEEL